MTASERPRWTRVAGYALSLDELGRVLLVRVAAGYPAAGRWTLPGGGLNFGEDPADGALRELEEETGLTGEILGVAFIDSVSRGPIPSENLGPWHGIRIVYSVGISGGNIRDEVDESSDQAAWFTLAEARGLPLVDLAVTALDHLEAGDVALAD